MHKLRSVQVLRAVAACAVVALHSYGFDKTDAEAGYAKLGAAGVDLFFVISGFIMANVSQGKTPRQFLSDRVWRIYPIWLIAVLPWMLRFPPDLPKLIASLTLWPIYGPAFVYPSLGLGWTLSFEMLFYVAMALALATRPIVPLAIFGACFALNFVTGNSLASYLGSPMILEFLAGVCIAKLPKDERLGGLALVGLLILALSPLSIYSRGAALIPEFAIVRVAWWGSAAALIVYGALCLERHFAGFRLPVLLGDASYSIYLFHLIAVNMLPVPWAIKLPLAVAFGLGCYLLIERRIARYHVALTRPSPPPPQMVCVESVGAQSPSPPPAVRPPQP